MKVQYHRQRNKRSGGGCKLQIFIRSTFKTSNVKGMYFSFDFGWYSIHPRYCVGWWVCLTIKKSVKKHDKSYLLIFPKIFWNMQA